MKPEINKTNFLDRIIKVLHEGIDRHNFKLIMFENIDVWRNFTLEQWLFVLESIRNSSLGLYTLLPFSHIYLGIDLYKYHQKLPDVALEVREYIDDEKEQNGFSYMGSSDHFTLKQFNLKLSDFDSIKERLNIT